MALFDRLRPQQKKSTPKVQAHWLFSNLHIDYNLNPTQLFDYYRTNPYVNAVINRIVKDVGSNGIEVRSSTVTEDWKDKDEKLMDDRLFEEYLNYNNNWQLITMKMFLESLVRDIEVCGNAYVYKYREDWKIVGYKRVDPRYMIPVAKEDWTLIWYVQNLQGARAFLPEDMVHIKENIWLDNELVGESKMTSLYVDLESDKEAKESNLAFFQNNQTPSSLIVVDNDYEITTDLLKEIKELFTGGKHKGGKNQHRSALIQWVKDIKPVQDKISDAEFVVLRNMTMKLTCAVYGVSPDIIWFTENSNRSVGDVQYEMYIDNTIIPKESFYQKFLTLLVQEALWEDHYAEIIQDTMRHLQKKSNIARYTYKDWILTRDEARDLLQYAPVDDDDVFYEWTWVSEVDEEDKLEN